MSCECIKITLRLPEGFKITTLEVNVSGVYDGQNYYQWTYLGETYFMYYNSLVRQWEVTIGGLGFPEFPLATAWKESLPPCPPLGSIPDWTAGYFETFTTSECSGPAKTCGLEDRFKKEYKSIKLPEIYEEENRGFFRCCCPFKVLASSSNDSWKNDITSAWIKLSGETDTVTCFLQKGGLETNYETTIVPFVNESNAYYWTINWNDVFILDGAGCYEIKIQYNISGIIQEFTWGIYHLQEFSIQNALTTARLRVRLNSHQEIEGINFTGSNVEDTIRFYGFIGNRQPKTEIDNLIYQNREMQKVIRENLNVYEVITDPTCEDHIKKITDLYLLSENELYISDYNAHNHSYRYNDLPVILEETAEITYFEFSRQASLKCIVSDKFKNQRSFY